MDVIYKLDGNDFKKFGVRVASSKGITSKPKPKNPISQNWETQNGLAVDLSKRYFEARDIVLSCFLEANNYGDFIQKFNAFTALFDTPNSKRLEVSMSVEDAGRNLLIDSSFENRLELIAGTNSLSLVNSQEKAYIGNRSAKATNFSPANVLVLNRVIDKTSTLSFYVYSDSQKTISVYQNPTGTWNDANPKLVTLSPGVWNRIEYHPIIGDYDKVVIALAETYTSSDVIFLDAFKLEYGSTATPWTPAPEDIAPLPFEVYLVDDIDPKKVWNNSKMVAEFELKLREPEPIKKVIKYTRTGDADKTVSITVNTPKLLNIYWGDGTHTYDVLGSQTITHNYATNGTFYIVVSGCIDEIVSLTTTGAIVWNKL
jgi:hypothetical protein